MGERQCEVIAVSSRGVMGQAADRKGALKGQLVHSKLIGMDQAAMSRGSRDEHQLTRLLGKRQMHNLGWLPTEIMCSEAIVCQICRLQG